MRMKYSYEFKLKLFKEYTEGMVYFGFLAEKYEIHRSQIQKWVADYKANGEEVLKRRKFKVYDGQFKINVVKYMHRTGSSLAVTARKFNLNSSTIVRSWEKNIHWTW
ncbi:MULTISPECIES: helix-turn-helix domain-containing protein [Listeria]|uniref:helix-turn-helix domain-containing protein n=1 Tax=Listeria TaxID=1637 RepID=UPI000B591BBA|nr:MULTISPECIES: helix-turn-helix domain-containing protein [Listeria]